MNKSAIKNNIVAGYGNVHGDFQSPTDYYVHGQENSENKVWSWDEVQGGESDEEPEPSPLERLYFNEEMFAKYEPAQDALQRCKDSEGQDEEAQKEFDAHLEKFMDFSWVSNWDGKKYDIIYYGVSGYTGYLMMEYLKRVALKRNPEKFTFAFAGRTVSKVREMRDREFAGTEWEDTPILQASFDDVVSMVDLAKSAHVIVNVAGPYMLSQGEVLIDACIHMGTHYVDVSGEIPWTLRTTELHRKAREKGVSIVPSAACAGGIPDVLCYLAAKKIKEKYGEETRKLITYWINGGAAGGASGGTLATRAAMSSADDDTRQAMADPFALGGFIPYFDRWGNKECSVQFGTGIATPKTRKEDLDAQLSRISEDPKNGVWRVPNPYAMFNSRIIRSSNALLADLTNEPYGRALNYQEFSMLPPSWAPAMSAAKAAGKDPMSALAPPGGDGPAQPASTSAADEKAALEKAGLYFNQGEGPELEKLTTAFTGWQIYAESDEGNSIKLAAIGADGYFETARAATEMAMTLRFDYDKLPVKGGVINAAVAGGTFYAKRLIDSGLRFRDGSWFEESEWAPPEGILG